MLTAPRQASWGLDARPWRLTILVAQIAHSAEARVFWKLDILGMEVWLAVPGKHWRMG
jgi:hypothetical protein